MTTLSIALFVLLEVKHFLFDFVFQTPYQLKNKGTYGHPGGVLHAGLHGIGTAIVLLILAFPWPFLIGIAIAEFLFHYHLDWAKEQIVRRTGGVNDAFFWRMIGLDQLLHQLSYICIAAFLFL